MWIISALVIGLIVGALAKFVMPGKDPGGLLITSLLGIAGAVVASWVGTAMGFYMQGEPAGFLASILGAMLILFFYRLLRKP